MKFFFDHLNIFVDIVQQFALQERFSDKNPKNTGFGHKLQKVTKKSQNKFLHELNY